MTTSQTPTSSTEWKTEQRQRLAEAWQQFQKEFPTEQHCVEKAFEMINRVNPVSCKHCGSTHYLRKFGSRTIQCLDCRKKTNYIASSFFKRSRSLRPWIGVIWLLENGVPFNSFQYHQHAGICYSAAFELVKKVLAVLQEKMDQTSLVLNSASFIDLYCKRSRETPAREHPSSEQQMAEKEGIGRPKTGENPHDDHRKADHDEPPDDHPPAVPEVDRLIFNSLGPTPLPLDVLSDRVGLSTAETLERLKSLRSFGLVDCLPGNCWVQVQPPLPEDSPDPKVLSARQARDAFKVFIRRTFHGISRKYLQNYLAAHWIASNPQHWTKDTLLEACVRSKPGTGANVLTQVAPLMVLVPFQLLCAS